LEFCKIERHLFDGGTHCWPDLALPGGDPIGVERQVLIGKPHD
jgi:hypothetical protein